MGFTLPCAGASPCTLVRNKKDAGSALLELVRGKRVVLLLCHLLIVSSRAKPRDPGSFSMRDTSTSLRDRRAELLDAFTSVVLSASSLL